MWLQHPIYVVSLRDDGCPFYTSQTDDLRTGAVEVKINFPNQWAYSVTVIVAAYSHGGWIIDQSNIVKPFGI